MATKSPKNTLDDPVLQYANDIVSGKITASQNVIASCRRHIRDLERKDIYFDVDAAAHAIDFFPDVLRLSEGQFEGIPFELQLVQKFIVGSIFGWKRPDGNRRFRRVFIEMGKGNGKSPLAGGIGLYGMLADKEAGAQIYAAAAKYEQAKILFNDAVKMVRQSPLLRQIVTISGNNPAYNLAHLDSGSFFRPIAKDVGKSSSGPRPHFALADEVHEHPDRYSLDMLERGFKFRRQPLLFMITNSGTDRNSVCWEEHQHAVSVALNDVEDDTTFSFVCSLDQGDDPLNDPSCWIKANPLLGVILTKEYLADVVAQAKAISGKLNNILRLHFCVWTDAETAWIGRSTWEGCEDSEMSMDDFEGKPCWVGLDLSATKDMTAVSYVFKDGIDSEGRNKFALFSRGYTPNDTLISREVEDKAPYSVWVRNGWLTATSGKIIRFDSVANDLLEASRRFDIQAVAYDRYLINTFEQVLDDAGIVLPLIEHPQGINQRKSSNLWMPQSINKFEELLLEGRLRIEANLALRSAVMSATLWCSPSGLRRFEKQRSTGRIDMAVASAMAIGSAESQEKVIFSPWDNPEFRISA